MIKDRHIESLTGLRRGCFVVCGLVFSGIMFAAGWAELNRVLASVVFVLAYLGCFLCLQRDALGGLDVAHGAVTLRPVVGSPRVIDVTAIESVKLSGMRALGVMLPTWGFRRFAPSLRLIGLDGVVLADRRVDWMPARQLRTLVEAFDGQVCPRLPKLRLEQLAPALPPPPSSWTLHPNVGRDNPDLVSAVDRDRRQARAMSRYAVFLIGGAIAASILLLFLLPSDAGWGGNAPFLIVLSAVTIWRSAGGRQGLWRPTIDGSLDQPWGLVEVAVLPGSPRHDLATSVVLLDATGQPTAVLPVRGMSDVGWLVATERRWVRICEFAVFSGRSVVLADLDYQGLAIASESNLARSAAWFDAHFGADVPRLGGASLA